jgi:hypothetical protein
VSGIALLLRSTAGGTSGVINTALPNGSAAGVAEFNLGNDGSTAISGNATGTWVAPATATIAAFYQVKIDATSGSFFSGTTGTWLDMSSNRQWTTQTPDPAVTFTISFREKASGTVRSTQAGVTLTAT